MSVRFQFSLRAVLVGMTLAAVVSGLLAFFSLQWRPLAAAAVLAACIYAVLFLLLVGFASIALNHRDEPED